MRSDFFCKSIPVPVSPGVTFPCLSLHPQLVTVPEATLIAGIPAENPTLFRKLHLAAGDPAAWLTIDGSTLVLIRDIERERAREAGRADRYLCPADAAPSQGLSPDRATATAQAVAELLRRDNVAVVRTDRTLPFIFAWHVMQAGIELQYDPDLGVLDRRTKTEEELHHLARAQSVTEEAMEMACGTIASALAAADGTLTHQGETLTSERVKAMIAGFLIDRGFSLGHGSIVATAPHSGDCHDSGTGPLKTERPVIVDIFPRDDSSRYWGDCTRTVVHGVIPDTVKSMHQAVVEAKAAGIQALQVGTSGEEVHRKVIAVQQSYGFPLSRGRVTDQPSIQHGTGHGIGLEVHEPILLDDGGGPILENEVFTVEPGLYGKATGGVRVEDMIVATASGPRNLNRLPDGLGWT